MQTVYDAKILGLPKIEDPRGNLSIIEQFKQIPFEIKRTYWIYDVPGGKDRGGHAYKENEEFIVALSGSFDVVLNDGKNEQKFQLNRSYCGLYVPKGMWRTMTNFSTNSLALVLSATEYDENDYIMDFEEFKLWRTKGAVSEVSKVSKVSNSNEVSVVSNVSIVSNSSTNTTETRNSETTETKGSAPETIETIETKGSAPETQKRLVSVFDCSLCELNKMHDPEGNLTYMYENVHVPFPINRVFYSYDIPGGEDRGAHAHKECHQFIIAASGAFEVVLDDGINKRTVTLNRPFWGLHVPPGIWASEQGFSSGSICLVLASHGYSEEDYIRNYDDFLTYVKERK